MRSPQAFVSSNLISDFDAWWDYSNPAGTESRFLELLQHVEALADPSQLAELLTQIARAQGFQRRFDDAIATLRRVEVMLETVSARARVRFLLEAGRVEHSSGQSGLGVPLFREALAAAEIAGEDALAVDSAHMLGIVTSADEQIAWNRRAIDMAHRSPDPKARRWLGTLYINMGWTHHDAGRFDEALRAFLAAEAWMQEHGNVEQRRTARWTVARCRRSLGAVEEALAIQRQLLREYQATGQEDGYVFEELGELLLMSGESGVAAAMFRKAHEILSKDPWRLTANEAETLLRFASSCGLK